MSSLNNKIKKTFALFILFLAFTFGFTYARIFRKEKSPANHQSKKLYRVVKVIDGDTIILDNGKHLRYIGINTPEINWKDYYHSDCYALEAKRENKKLVGKKYIRLEKDVSESDKYGRLLRYVYVGNIFVNKYLIKEGFAQIDTYPPDLKYVNIFQKEEENAQKQNKGLWNNNNCK